MTDVRKTIEEADRDLKGKEDRILTGSGAEGDLMDPLTVWSRDPGPDVRRMEETKQQLSRQSRERGEDPAPNLSDDALFRKLGDV